MAALDLVERLQYARKVGENSWSARCPAHDDKNPSLSVTDLPDGRVRVKCFAGCGALDVITAVGLEWAALFPPVDTRYKPIYSRPKDEEHERIVIAICEADRAAGKRLTKAEKARELEAFKRVHGGKR